MTSMKVNLAAVGAFVLAALVTLVLSLAVLAGRTGPTDGYYTVYANVAGLKFGSQVVFEGYPVGQVERIKPVDDGGRVRFRIEMSVTRGWKIPDDSVATLESSGVLAPVIVAIAAGKSSRALEPGAMIPPGESGGWLASLSSVAGSVDQLTESALLPLVDNLNRQVTLLGEVLNNDLRPMAANANRIVAATAQHWPAIMANADRVSGQLDGLIDKDRVAAVDRLILNLDRAAQDLQQTTAALQSLTQTGGADLKTGAQEFRFVMESLSRNVESFSQNLNSTSLNLQDFSRQIRQNPGILLRAPEPRNDPVPPLRDTRP